MHTTDIGTPLARETSQPKHLEANCTAEASAEPTTSPPNPVRDACVSKKKRYKSAATAGAGAGAGAPLTAPHKRNAHDAKPKQTEFNQKGALRDLGIMSLALVDNQQFNLIDPTLGDWACQLRALWLIDFAKKYSALKTTQSSALTREQLRSENPVILAKDLEILGMYRLSTLFTTVELDLLGMRKNIRTNARATTPEENAAGWKFGSSSQNKAAFNYTKTTLGDAVNQSLIESLKSSSLPDKEAYLANFTRSDIVRQPMGDHNVSVVGFFGGCRAFLDLAAERNLPLAVTLKKFVRDMDDNVRLEGVEMATFSTAADSSSGKRVYVCDAEARRSDEVGIVIYMFSCFHATSSAASETDPNLDAHTFFANARRLAFGKFNASYDGCSALHAQHPPQTHIRGSDGEFLTDDAGNPLELLHKPQGVQIDATPALTRMRESAADFALVHGIGQGTYYTAATGPDKTPVGKHFDESIPLNIVHVHVASSNGVALEMRNYIDKYGRVVIPADTEVNATSMGYKVQTTKIRIPERNNIITFLYHLVVRLPAVSAFLCLFFAMSE